MDWEAALRERLADPANQAPYRLAAGDHPPATLSGQLHAVAGVLGVKPDDLSIALRNQFGGDHYQVERFIQHLAGIADQACGLEPQDGTARDDEPQRRVPQPIPPRQLTEQAKANAHAAWEAAVKHLDDDRAYMQVAGAAQLRRAAEMSPDPATLRMISDSATDYIKLKALPSAAIDRTVLTSLHELIDDIAATPQPGRPAIQRHRATPHSPPQRVPRWRAFIKGRTSRGE